MSWSQDQNGDERQQQGSHSSYLWNQDNHGSYYHDANYVNFNEFLNQYQSGNTRNGGNSTQYYYQRPTTSFDTTYQNYQPTLNQPENNISNAQSTVNIFSNPEFKSNLTPTASEFIPKSIQKQNSLNGHASSSQDINVASTSQATYVAPKQGKRSIVKTNNNNWEGKTFYNTSRQSNSVQDARYKNNGDKKYHNNGRKLNTYGGTHRLRNYDVSTEDEDFARNYHLYHADNKPYNNRSNEKIQVVPSKKTSTHNRNEINEKKNDEETAGLTQRERLEKQLNKGMLECLVCCDRIRQIDAVWSCLNCFHVFHLKCIKKWATSSLTDNHWRCPACQNQNESIPSEYYCMCGRQWCPQWQRVGSAHCCGQQCSRPRSCPHPCTLLCHPGPCPPCEAVVQRKCGCGAETRSITCSNKLEQTCDRTCGKPLNCQIHHCQERCHVDDCEPCDKIRDQVCYCPSAKSRTIQCGSESSKTEDRYSCGNECGRVLECGNHVCRNICHTPPCQPCKLLPSLVLTCPCGKKRLTEDEERMSCVDPIPLCGNICAKPLDCGPVNDKHFCKEQCHDGECPQCPDKTLLNCRCGHTSREVACTELAQLRGNIFCQRKCNKKLSCGRHRCREVCCAQSVHRCPAVCERMLSCGQHRCHTPCHTGHCSPCPRLSFNELRCTCGAAVRLPPVECGARPPVCNAPCSLGRECGHPPHHQCHPSTDECPPCVVLTTRICHGKHEERKTIPCHQKEFSCGLPCGKQLSCGKHLCIKICHKDDCETSPCRQACTEARSICGHPCGAVCHATDGGQCPSRSPCKVQVTATCMCGRKTATKLCTENARDAARLASTLLASKMQDNQHGDVGVEITETVVKPGMNLKTIECDEECRVEHRARQLAAVLQLDVGPDISSRIAPKYSEHIRQWAVKDAAFVQMVHDKLTDLVQKAKVSKQKNRSYSFPSMNRSKRQLVHEMCEHFICDSIAYDAEPNRNVVATADREKSCVPSLSILDLLERETGRRRVPGPILSAGSVGAGSRTNTAWRNSTNTPAATTTTKSGTGWATLTSSYGSAWGSRFQTNPATSSSPTATAAKTQATKQPPKIDYFDNPPDS